MLDRAGRGGAFSEAINEMDDVGMMILGVGGDARPRLATARQSVRPLDPIRHVPGRRPELRLAVALLALG